VLELKVHDGEADVTLRFEHSLLSLSKWEAKHKKAFITDKQKTHTELIDYFECMLLPPVLDTTLVLRLSPEQLDQLTEYMNDSQTASSVPVDKNKKGTGEIVTSELIYYWMVALTIPFEAETWHLNRLMMLVQIANFKQQPPKKRSVSETMSDWKKLNAERKAQYGTNG
jgi:hypothetical protein